MPPTTRHRTAVSSQQSLENTFTARIDSGESPLEVLADAAHTLQLLAKISDGATGEARDRVEARRAALWAALYNRSVWARPAARAAAHPLKTHQNGE